MRLAVFLAVAIGAVVAAWLIAASARAAFGEPGTFRHRRSKVLAKMGSPRHSAGDVVVSPRQATTVEGKFSYTKASKDLEDEEVTAEVMAGKRWHRLGTRRTDSDGRVRFEVPGRLLRKPGAVRYRMTVAGDRTSTGALIYVWAPGTRVVVFDIDGTLTPGDREIIKRAVWGSAVAVRPGAADVVRHWIKRQAIKPVYLTGRPYLFSADTRAWLERHGFPPGPLITADSLRQVIPSTAGVGKFKETWLKQLKSEQKLDIIAAYGNADTDVCAFARAGIAPKASYIFGEGERKCEGFDAANTITDFVAHLATLPR